MTRPVLKLDVSKTPTFAFGPANALWWGNLAFMVIEGLAFVFSIATYLYTYNHNKTWPLGSQPGLLWSSLIVAVMIISEFPNIWLKRAAKAKDLPKVRLGLIVMSLIALICLGLRCCEFTTLSVRWDENAYGSILWFLLALHTTHLLTDAVETWVMAVMIHIGPVDMRRFPEVQDNQDYWHFVVFFWVAIYVTLYWLPRWLEIPS